MAEDHRQITLNPVPRFQASTDARILYDRIRQMKVGETLTYPEIAGVVGVKTADSRTKGLRTAMKMAMRLDNMDFAAVHKIGYKRLSDVEIVDTVDQAMGRVRRGARRAANRLGHVQAFGNLPVEKQEKHNAALSLFNVVGSVTTTSSFVRIEKAVQKARHELPMADTLKALGLVEA